MSTRLALGLAPALRHPLRRPIVPIRCQLQQSFHTSSSHLRPLPLLTRPPPSRPALAPSSLASASTLRLPIQALRRAFHTSPSSLIRQTYYPRGSGSPPPSGGWFRRFRRRIDRLPWITVTFGLIGINVLVFLVWQYALQSWQRFRDPSLYQFMTRNFLMSEANVMAGRVWTLITASFSHMDTGHIFVNCLGLYFIAPAALGLLGPSAFLGLYFTGGLVSSLTSLLWHRVRGDRWVASEGASGAIYSTLAFYGAMFPQAQILMFFIIPMPVWVALSGIFAWDFYQAVGNPGSRTDSAGHIGGILAGLGAAVLVRRGRFRF